MDEETKPESSGEEANSNIIYYVIGAVLLVVVIGAGYLLKSKSPTQPADATPVADTTVAEVVNTGPITGFGCEKQYYNPVVGIPKYFLSTEGVDVPGATKVTCTYSVTVNKEVIATDTVTTSLTDKADRNGSVFTCTTKQLSIPAQVPAKVDVEIKDDKDATATCTASFLLPRP